MRVRTCIRACAREITHEN